MAPERIGSLELGIAPNARHGRRFAAFVLNVSPQMVGVLVDIVAGRARQSLLRMLLLLLLVLSLMLLIWFRFIKVIVMTVKVIVLVDQLQQDAFGDQLLRFHDNGARGGGHRVDDVRWWRRCRTLDDWLMRIEVRMRRERRRWPALSGRRVQLDATTI